MDLWCKDDLASQRAGSAVPKLRSRQTMAAVDSSPVHIRPHAMPAMMPPGWQDAAGPLKRGRAAATGAGPVSEEGEAEEEEEGEDEEDKEEEEDVYEHD